MGAPSYRGTDVAVEPTADGRELLSSWLDDARILAPPYSGALLGHCAGFRPLAEHARHVCRVTGLPTERVTAVERRLRALASSGALMSRDRLLDRIRAQVAADATHRPIAGVGVPTRDRPALLRRCLESYMRNGRDHGRDLEFVVFDDAREPSGRAESLAVLRTLHGSLGTRVAYSGGPEREAYAAALSRESGVPLDTVRFALVGTDGMVSTGACRNALLLHFLGSGVVHVDDDTICSVAPAPNRRHGLAIESVHITTDYAFFATPDEARAAVSFVPRDYFGLYEPLLGQTVAAAVDGLATDDAIDLDLLEGPFARRLAQTPCRIAIASPGVVGDSGLGSTEMYFFTGGADTRARLLAFPGGHRRAFESHCMVRSTGRMTIAGSGPCLGINLGLDLTSSLLPPFMPRLRDSDGVFAQVRRTCALDTAMAFLPWVVEHAPAAPRRSSIEAITAAAGRVPFSVVLRGFVTAFDASPAIDPADRMMALGRHLVEVASRDQDDYIEACRRHCQSRVDNLQMYSDSMAAVGGDASAEWRADLAAYLMRARRVARSIDGVAPRDLSRDDLPARDAIAIGQDLLRQYGVLLGAWPAITSAARTLQRRGERPARSVADAACYGRVCSMM